MDQKKHLDQLAGERDRLERHNLKFVGETVKDVFARHDREESARDLAREKIEQFESEQQHANQWISFWRLARWYVGKGNPVKSFDDLLPAFAELRGDLRSGQFHDGDDAGLIILTCDSGSPSAPWRPTLTECKTFIDAFGPATFGNDTPAQAQIEADRLRARAYFAQVEDGTRLVGGAWLRHDLALRFFAHHGCPLPPWLPADSADTQENASDEPLIKEMRRMVKEGEALTASVALPGRAGLVGKPTVMPEVERQLDEWIVGGRDRLRTELVQRCGAGCVASKALIARALERPGAKPATIEKSLKDKLGIALSLLRAI